MYNLEGEKLNAVQKLLAVRNETLIKKVNRLLDDEMIVAYTTSGKGLTTKAYNERLKKAEKQIKSGHFLSQDQAEKEAEDW
ncbi:MAG TPA: hypothetical protein VNZ86_08170 [Bacteroidia bacterium]|jgi:hypothetical protein|nr:hypothetical protein [Bacteroidia bacterium]